MTGGALAKLWVELGLRDELSKGLTTAKANLQSWGKSLTNAGRKMTTGVTLPLIAGGTAAVKWASDLNEATSAVGTVFGKSAGQIAGFNGSVASSLGLSREEALSAAAGLGALYQSVGVTGDAAATMSNQMVQAGADLGSFFNVPIDQVLEDIKSGLVGESEPLRKYGILLSEAAVQQRALADTGKKNADELTEGEKVLARQELIYEGLGAAQGDFARTSGGLANKTRIVKAQFKDAAAQLGQQLLPLVLKGVQYASKLIERFNKLSPSTKKWVLIIAGLAAALGPVLLVVGHLMAALGAIIAIAPAIGAAVSLMLGPFGLVILAVGFLAVAYAKNWFGIRDITNKVVGAIVDFIQPVIDVVVLLGHYFHDVATNKIQPGNLAKLPKWLQPIAFVLGRIIKTARVFIVTWQRLGALAAFKTIPKQIRAFGRAVANLFDSMGLHHFADAVKDTFYDLARLFTHVVDLIDDLVHGRWKQVWGDLKNIAVDLFWLFIDRFKMAGALLLDIFNLIPWGTIGTALWNGLSAAVGFLVTTGIPWLLVQGASLIRSLLGGMQSVWENTLKPWLLGMASQIVGAVINDDTVKLLYDAGRLIVSWIWTGVSSLIDWFAVQAHAIPNSIIDGVESMYMWFYNTGRNIISGIWTGFASLKDWVEGQVMSWIDGLMQSVKDRLGIGSPSKEFAKFGRYTMLGFAKGVLAEAGTAQAAVTRSLSFDAGSIAAPGTPRLAAMPAVAGVGGGGSTSRSITFAPNSIVINEATNGEQIVNEIRRAIRRREAGMA